MKIVVKEIYLDKDIKEAFSIRGKVFVEGMNIPVEIELDKYDKVAHQIIAYADEIPAGTARWRKTKEGLKLERFAVLPEYILKTLKNEKNIYLNSQHTAIGFYEKLGFYKKGKSFKEAGILHQKMFLKK